ncbi:peptidylprolyl isomerase [Oleiphilus sp. HI0009]|uniref:peptidylprolyl isomerase n=1 Tax=unclassified Oleiphilus TaxID=2631174 RepID=UPI0007C287E4|nr:MULTISPECIES: peptidylprolyl isomerase [unclassified Oleiphilus]KZX76400.1 peptidylprolyl isomerase [Oleiphilus sp. HI0009]KZX81650.1 peptidylprolyl isomerase [Oleiphilus sp. HI0009]KZY66886.1 peptidylprolyl isomerase [Oleiphilus sp. HI0066]KZY73865.1 peptidylprolyl isomerase [Oleiphilus sp. HI0067]KZY74254.1 peptidylprolyl isomerase [Oleiphilus sp. HI0067]
MRDDFQDNDRDILPETNVATAMAKHILVKTREEAEQLKKQLILGKSFEALAKKHSTCPSKKKGGDLGEIRKGQLVKPIEKVIFTQPLKKIHGPVKSQFGFHLIQVYYRD